MFFLKCLVVAISAFALAASVAGEQNPLKVYDVGRYGADPKGIADSGYAIRRAISDAVEYKGPAEVYIKAGKYRVGSAYKQSSAITISKAKSLVIRGEGTATELIITNPEASGIVVSESTNVTVKDLAIDYDPLPFTQGTVSAVDPDNCSFDFTLDKGFPLLSEPYFTRAPARWGMLFDPNRKILKPGAPDFIYLGTWSKIKENTWRVTLADSDKGKIESFVAGDRFVQIARSYANHGVVFWKNKNVSLEGVTIYASLAAATVFGLNDKYTVRGLSVRIRPGSDRLLSTNADGIHCPTNRSGVLIENCYFEGMADDGINLYTPPAVVKKLISPTQLLVSNGYTIQKRDLLQVHDPVSGRVLGEVKVKDTKDYEGNTLLTLAKAADGIVVGSDHRDSTVLYNLNYSNQSYIIRNNRFGKHRGRQVLLRAGKGVVRNNVFESVGSCGVAIYNEPDYPEGPVPYDISVLNNKFLGTECYPNGAAMQITPMKLGYGLAEGRGIINIRIVGNLYKNVGASYIAGVSGIEVLNNRIEADSSDVHKINTGLFTFEDCGNVVVDSLYVSDSRTHGKPAIDIRSGVDRGEKGIQIRNLTGQNRDILDQRSQ